MAISIKSTTNCVTSVVVILLMAVDLANGVYIRERKKYPTRDYADDDGTQTSSLSRHQKTQNISTELVPPSRREPFRRILVSNKLIIPLFTCQLKKLVKKIVY